MKTSLLSLLALGLAVFVCAPQEASASPAIREVKYGDDAFKLYPDTEELTSDTVSVSIDDRRDPDSCSGLYAGSYFNLEQKGDCTLVTLYRESGKIESQQNFCASTVMKFAGHTYKIKEILPRCERFARNPSPNGGILHPELYRSPLVRLVDEEGQAWVSSTARLSRYVRTFQEQKVLVNGSCTAEAFAFRRFEKAKRCAVEAAKTLANKTCSDLNGQADPSTLTPDGEPWMCYGEAFNEAFCAVYAMSCKL